MKYLVIGCCILAVLLTVCILAGAWLNAATSHAQELLQKAVEAVHSGDSAEAVKYALAAQKHWQEQQGIFSSILSHNEVDEVAAVFSQLVVCDPVRDAVTFNIYCAQLQTRIQSIADMGQLLLPNIL